jgi:hypothetical protein
MVKRGGWTGEEPKKGNNFAEHRTLTATDNRLM